MNLDPSRRKGYRVSAATLSVAIGLGTAACGGAKPECDSPWKAHGYPHGAPDALQSDINTWQGIELRTDLPAGDRLRVDFTDPGGNRHISSWIDGNDARYVAMRIGYIGTVIRTQIQAPAGAPACTEEPDTKFIKKDYRVLLYEGDAQPGGWQLEQSR